MAIHDYRSASTEQNSYTTRGDQPARASHVPPVLKQLFERPADERSVPKPFDVFQPTDWPPCPDCGDRLLATAVATDAQETLVAAAMRCYNSEHESRQYVYNVATDTVYFDQVLAGPVPGPPDG
jgi:hypothetical protein